MKERRARLDEERLKQERISHYNKCPKCGCELEERDHNGVKIDQCSECSGMWLDKGELELIEEIDRHADRATISCSAFSSWYADADALRRLRDKADALYRAATECHRQHTRYAQLVDKRAPDDEQAAALEMAYICDDYLATAHDFIREGEGAHRVSRRRGVVAQGQHVVACEPRIHSASCELRGEWRSESDAVPERRLASSR